MNFRIEIDESTSDTISFHTEAFEELTLSKVTSPILEIGAFNKAITMNTHKHHDKNILRISRNLYQLVNLPLHLQYTIQIYKNKIQIGPIIGILMPGKIETVTPRKLSIFLNYLAGDGLFNGLVLVFTLDGIDDEQKKVSGYAYNPHTHRWEAGDYVFPAAVFCRRTLKENWRIKISRLTGNRFFNSHVINKWELYQYLVNNPSFRKYLPETKLAEPLTNVKKLLEQYGTIYLKPIKGMQGSDIYQIEKKGEDFIFRYRLNNQNMVSILERWENASLFIQSKIKPSLYLVQQGVPLYKVDDRLVDLRVITQKNGCGRWRVQGMVARYGEKESIVSNISSGGMAENGWDAMMKIFNKNDKAKSAYQKYKELELLTYSICEWLDKTGIHLGNIGFDFGIDTNGQIWIIELNNRDPDATIALDANNDHLYLKAKSTPLKYAKWLSMKREER